MPNITRGARMSGLLAYLAGPGKANEHVEPHLVAGSAAVLAWQDGEVLDRAGARQAAMELDRPRVVFGTDVTLPVTDRDGHIVARKPGHVWHCSLSLRAEEGELSDEVWAGISEDFVAGMGFAGEGVGEAPCRWAALRHGLSKGGNDHVHVVVGLVRQDGTKAKVFRDRVTAQRVAGELERKYGLVVLESREAGHAMAAEKPGEREAAAREGVGETSRARLTRTVRGCAAAAEDEAEFVRRVRDAGILIRPRYAKGRTDVVEGYSVAIRPPGESPGEGTPVWYGGGRLGRDLTLPRLRQAWPDTPQDASGAVAQWRSAAHNDRPPRADRDAGAPDAEVWVRYTDEVSQLRERLREVAVDDHARWAAVANDAAGMLAAWSLAVEQRPGPLAEAADALARSAQLPAARAHRAPREPSVRGAARLLSGAASPSTIVARAAMLRQLANTAQALHDAHVAAGHAQRANEVAAAIRTQLMDVRSRLGAERDAQPVTHGLTGDEQARPAVGPGQVPPVPGVAGSDAAVARTARRRDARRGPERDRGNER